MAMMEWLELQKIRK